MSLCQQVWFCVRAPNQCYFLKISRMIDCLFVRTLKPRANSLNFVKQKCKTDEVNFANLDQSLIYDKRGKAYCAEEGEQSKKQKCVECVQIVSLMTYHFSWFWKETIYYIHFQIKLSFLSNKQYTDLPNKSDTAIKQWLMRIIKRKCICICVNSN